MLAIAATGAAAPVAHAAPAPVAGGEHGLLEFLTDGLCKTTQGLGQATARLPLVGQITGAVSGLVCNANLLEYDFRTEFTRPNGTVLVRHNTALLGVPRPLNVDDDALPELIGTVTLGAADRLVLKIDKLPTAEATLPAQVEMITRDPRNSRSDSRIAFGYDARPASVPQSWQTSLILRSLSKPYRLGLQMQATKPGASLALLGELYSKRGADGRTTQASARLNYLKVPATTGAELTLGDDAQHVTVTSATRVPLNGRVSLVEGNAERRVNATIDALPTQVDIDVTSAGAKQRIDYRAAQPIHRLDATYRELDASSGTAVLKRKATAQVTDLPRGLTFQRTGAAAGRVTTDGGAVGSIRGSFAAGEPEPLLVDESGVRVVTEGGATSIAARLDGVTAATFDAGKPYLVDIASKRQPFSLAVEDRDANRTIAGRVEDLPQHVALSFDPDRGKLGFDGHGEGINAINVAVKDDDALFKGVKTIEGTVRGVPAAFDLTFHAASGEAVEVASTAPLGELELKAGDQALLPRPIAAGRSGVQVVDSAAGFGVHARIGGLKSVSFNPSPIAGRITTATPTGLDLYGRVDGAGTGGQPLVVSGTIDKLPDTVEFAARDDGQGGKYIAYTASARIEGITLDVDGLTLGRATHIMGRVRGLPKQLLVHLPAPGGKVVEFSTDGQSIDQVEFQATDGSLLSYRRYDGSFSSVEDGFTYRDIADGPDRQYGIAVQLSGLRGGSFQLEPSPEIALDVDPAKAQLFGVSVRRRDAGSSNAEFLQGYVNVPPPNMRLKIDQTNGTRLAYSADRPINSIVLEGNIGVPFMRASLVNLPTRLDACFGTESEPRCLRPLPAGYPVDTERKVQLDIDDHDTSPAGRPVSIDAFICINEARRGACQSADVMNNKDVRQYAIIRNMQIHNLSIDLNAGTCFGLLLCGHITADTRDRPFRGQIDYQDRDATGALDRIFARMTFPDGFSASQRHARWSGEPIGPGGSADQVIGRVRCPAGMGIQIATDPLGPVDDLTVLANFGPNYLCKSPQG